MASSALLAATSNTTATASTSTNPDLNKNPNTINLNSSPQSLNQPMSSGGVGGVRRRTVEDVWKGIVEGGREKEKEIERKVCKVEVPDDMMTLEDFLVMAGAVDKEEIVAHVEEEEEEEEEDVKVMRVPLSGSVSASVGMMSNSRLFSFDSVPLSPFQSNGGSMYGSGMLLRLGSDVGGGGGIGREKRRGSGAFENLDKAAQKRQRRMIKNRESAARSRERKQEHQVKLESLASKLEEENAQLLKEKAAQTKERLKLLMEQIIPVVEQRKPPRPLRRVNSWEW